MLIRENIDNNKKGGHWPPLPFYLNRFSFLMTSVVQ